MGRQVILMPQISVKITQISKDFDLKSKDVLDTFKDLGIDKKKRRYSRYRRVRVVYASAYQDSSDKGS